MLITLLTLSAHADADLSVSLTMPTGTAVYDEDTVWVDVSNVGNKNAQSVSLTIQLPQTNTSPTVSVMGDLGAYDGDCTQSGTTLDCSLGRLKRGESVSVYLDIALPQSAAALTFEAEATTTSAESNTANNIDDADAVLTYYDVPISGPAAVTNQHCTGVGLTAFYECTLSPSSISSHAAILESDGSITLGYPGYTGSWSQSSADTLWFAYTYYGTVVATFSGEGVDGSCFEGLTTFPGSAYVSPYQVCLD